MSHYVIRWEMLPSYADFTNTPPEHQVDLEVVEADDLPTAITRATQRMRDTVTEQITSVTEVRLTGNTWLNAYVNGGHDLDVLVWDREDWHVIETHGDDPRHDGTGLYEVAVPLLLWMEALTEGED